MSNQGKERYRISWSEGNYYIWDNEINDWVSDPKSNRPLPFKKVKKAEAFVDTPVQKETSTETEYKVYRCRKCGHEVMAQERPATIRWDDGHTCRFIIA